jgi:hypothetical protein
MRLFHPNCIGRLPSLPFHGKIGEQRCAIQSDVLELQRPGVDIVATQRYSRRITELQQGNDHSAGEWQQFTDIHGCVVSRAMEPSPSGKFTPVCCCHPISVREREQEVIATDQVHLNGKIDRHLSHLAE